MDVQQLLILQLTLIAKGIEYSNNNNKPIKYLVCGGGRKNNFLIQSIKDYLSHKKNISLI
jgi:anhydro-N-acetylmuramic acid kinase